MHEAEKAERDLNTYLRTRDRESAFAPAHTLFARYLREKYNSPADWPDNSTPTLDQTPTLVTISFNQLTAREEEFLACLRRHKHETPLHTADLLGSFWQRYGQTAPAYKARKNALTLRLPDRRGAEAVLFEAARWFPLKPSDKSGFNLIETNAEAAQAPRQPKAEAAGDSRHKRATILARLTCPDNHSQYVMQPTYPIPAIASDRMDQHAAELGGRVFSSEDISQNGLFFLAYTDEHYPYGQQHGGPEDGRSSPVISFGPASERFYEFDSSKSAVAFREAAEQYLVGMKVDFKIRVPSYRA